MKFHVHWMQNVASIVLTSYVLTDRQQTNDTTDIQQSQLSSDDQTILKKKLQISNLYDHKSRIWKSF